MKNHQIAVLLTCHNRREKTLVCLASLFAANLPSWFTLDIFLVDDGSTDGTSDAVKKAYPHINLIKGDGGLFWAGGMSLAWKKAMQRKVYDAYLLLNDDVRLYPDFFDNLLAANYYSLIQTGVTGIYSGATIDARTNKVTYGGSKIVSNHVLVRNRLLIPKEYPQPCEITNANVLWISKNVTDQIGIFDEHFTHGIADYDYSLRAHKKNIPVFLAPNICGACIDDHGGNWKKSSTSLKERIAYLKSPKGLAYDEYLYYVKKHFPLFLPYSFVMLWAKTLLPMFWDKYKK